MAAMARHSERRGTVDHVSREAQVRVDERVEEILAREALRQARHAAQRLDRSPTGRGVRGAPRPE